VLGAAPALKAETLAGHVARVRDRETIISNRTPIRLPGVEALNDSLYW